MRRLGPSGSLLVCGLLVHCARASAPAFLWWSSSASPAERTVLEAVPGQVLVDGLLPSLVSGQTESPAAQRLLQLTGGAAPQRADVLAVFVSRQLAAQQQTLSQLSDQLEPLQEALRRAPASLALPHVTYKGAPNVAQALRRRLSTFGSTPRLVELGECGGVASSSQALTGASLKAALSEATQQEVLLLCPTAASLAEETALFEDLHAALNATLSAAQRSYAFAYVAQPSAEALAQARRRELLEGQSNPAGLGKGRRKYDTCDARCETQVKLLEGAILAFNVLAAIWVGSWMLHNLGTPTRFEAPPKDQSNRDM